MAAQRRRGTGANPPGGGRGNPGDGGNPGNRGTRGNRSAWGARPAGGGPDLAAQRARLREIVAPVVENAGYDLEELSVSRVGRRHLVRVVVDGDRGVSLETIADLSREISPALDAAEETGGDFLANEYLLEVSSPGVDRPLTQPRHWRRNVGRLVKAAVDGRGVEGRILSADDAAVILALGGTDEVVPYDRLGPGRVQIEFTRMEELSDDDLGQIDDEEEEDEE
jgi:ribosome maturation factor RimP